MRIVHLINYFNDNLDYQENNLIKIQSTQGHQVSLITSDRLFPFKNYEQVYRNVLGNRIIGEKKYKYYGADVIRKKTLFEFKKHAQCFFPYIFDILKIKPEVIHIHNCGTYNFITIFLFSLFYNFKIFIDCHQDELNTKKGLIYFLHNKLWKFIYSLFKEKISLFLPINDSSKKFLLRSYNIDKNKIKISPLGYKKFSKLKIEGKIKLDLNFKKLKSSKKQLLILNSGKQNESKRISKLIDLIIILNKKGLNSKLILIGNPDQDYKVLLKNKIKKLNFLIGKNKILLLPMQSREKLRCYLYLSDIAIWPGNPSITIQEALYFNNLIFLSKENPSSHLLSSELLYFYNEDLYKTARNIIRIKNNNLLRQTIVTKNKQILKKLEWNKINSDLVNYYLN